MIYVTKKNEKEEPDLQWSELPPSPPFEKVEPQLSELDPKVHGGEAQSTDGD